MGKKVRVGFHDRCFDGTASAAVFSLFYRECVDAAAEFHYTGLVHQPAGVPFDDSIFDGDENVIVDFKYSSSPRLTWWFDHHQSAFLTPEDAEHFRQHSNEHKYYDPGYKSCTKLLATVGREKFGFRREGLSETLAELIEWADIIDGAQYESPEVAVKMNVPATQLALVIEASADDRMTVRLIDELGRRPLAEILKLSWLAPEFDQLYRRHENSLEVLRQQSQFQQGVVYFDLVDFALEGYNKFIPYFLYPECFYSVGLTRTAKRIKLSVGSNPWRQPPAGEEKNLASICERHGGGGHARVAAISFTLDQVEQARATAKKIAAELRA